jgi:hypothetical protein
MVLKKICINAMSEVGMTRTIAYVGKKLGWEKRFGVDMRCYDACCFESLGCLEVVVGDDCRHRAE